MREEKKRDQHCCRCTWEAPPQTPACHWCTSVTAEGKWSLVEWQTFPLIPPFTLNCHDQSCDPLHGINGLKSPIGFAASVKVHCQELMGQGGHFSSQSARTCCFHVICPLFEQLRDGRTSRFWHSSVHIRLTFLWSLFQVSQIVTFLLSPCLNPPSCSPKWPAMVPLSCKRSTAEVISELLTVCAQFPHSTGVMHVIPVDRINLAESMTFWTLNSANRFFFRLTNR
jgi:hypothetical protein